MAVQEKSLQQLDPLAAGTSWDSTLIIVILSWSYALLMTVLNFADTTDLPLLITALALLSIGLGAHLWFAHPSHAPYRRWSYTVIVLFTISAGACEIAAMAGSTVSFVQEWGPISVALLFASASGYRPLSDQYYAGLAAVLVLGAELWIVGISSELPFGPAYFAVSGISLIAIVVLGQASYTMKATKVYFAWIEAAERDAHHISTVRVPSMDVAQTFLIEVLESGKISESDRVAAQEISTQIRTELLNLSQGTWLEHAGYSLHDPTDLAQRFDASSQTTFLTLLEGLGENNIVDINVSFTLDPKTRRISVAVIGRSTQPKLSQTRLRTLLSPYLRVMYVIFDDVRIFTHEHEVKVMFYYDR